MEKGKGEREREREGGREVVKEGKIRTRQAPVSLCLSKADV